jgi:hypothetical protein
LSGLGGEDGDGLGALHDRLLVHFGNLRDLRRGNGAPVFALEHGLAPAEVAILRSEVASAIARGDLCRDAWLPLVVYATELGYDFSGDEYWQTFEGRTPGWAERADRAYLRLRFREFTDLFGGARPAGPWAKNFSIICWPITHAVLPADLQRHLARLLFDYRRALTSNLLADPEELGRHLAARSFDTSARFRHFAQNVSLLGRVAASLLLGENTRSPLLLNSTLDRIVEDLSRERAARRWLHGARAAVARLETRGFLPSAMTNGEGATDRAVLAPLTDPRLSIQQDADDWVAFMEIPDLSALGGRFPEVGEELADRRVVLAGVSGAPVARGRLLYPGQRFRLRDWPAATEPVITVEGGEAATNSILAEQSVLSPGPWLFRVRAPGYAAEVRSKRVRPGGEYVLLSEDPLPADLPTWICAVPIATGRVHALEVRAPSVIKGEHVACLRRLGVGTQADLEVRPAGLFPASWDGQGQAEWLAGEDAVLAVTSTRSVTKLIWVLDEVPVVVPWPEGESRIFIEIEGLSIGRHQVLVSVFDPDDSLVAEEAMVLDVRPHRPRPEGGTGRHGLVIVPTPVAPTLNELWDGDAVLEVRGPAGVDARIELHLRDRSGSKAAFVETTVRLPVDAQDWAGLFERILRRDEGVQKAYDEVETCEIRVSHEDLGAVTLRCERPFAPLRWAAGRDARGPLLRLINNTEGSPVEIRLSDFRSPDRTEIVPIDERSDLRFSAGGLAVAAAGSATAAMILPPTVRHLGDFRPAPRLSPVRASLETIKGRIELAGRWGSASRSYDPFGEFGRVQVQRAIAADLAGAVGGHQWSVLERRKAEVDDVSEDVLLGAIGTKTHQRAVGRDVARSAHFLVSEPPEERAESFATTLAANARVTRHRSEDPRFAEFLLRLASAPDSLCEWEPHELSVQIQRVLTAPFLIRAARCLVFAIEARATPGLPATFEGWAWR